MCGGNRSRALFCLRQQLQETQTSSPYCWNTERIPTSPCTVGTCRFTVCPTTDTDCEDESRYSFARSWSNCHVIESFPFRALEHLIPVTKMSAVKESGMSPLHSAAAGGHAQCVETLLKAGYDPNVMLHPRVRRNYDDERRSALFFAVANSDLQCTRLLLEAGAMVNQDPVSCLQVALRQGNYELINTLLKFGANVNYYSRLNATHFPSALQHALKDEVMLRMILNHGYDVKRCFDCPYGDSCHDDAAWTTSIIKDMVVRQRADGITSCRGFSSTATSVCVSLQFCEVITVSWLKHLSAQVVRIMLDYTDHVSFCNKLKETLMEQKQWPDICRLQRKNSVFVTRVFADGPTSLD